MTEPNREEPHYHGHRDRLRARLMEVGGDALPEYELLELVLFLSVPRKDVKPLAKELLRRFGSFSEVLSAPPQRLKEFDGLGETAVANLKIVEAAARRFAKGAVAKRPVLSSWSAVIDYCRAAMAFAEKEQFRLLLA
jgi:DNA repair protein RadC